MPAIFHSLVIKAPADKVFAAISTAQGLDKWWTWRSEGFPETGQDYLLDFGPQYIWKARVTQSEKDRAFELWMTEADTDWLDTRVGFQLKAKNSHLTQVDFRHTGWKDINEHFTVSSYCWAMYLRILRRYIEHGETVPYQKRLEV